MAKKSPRLIAFCSPAMGCGKTAAAMELVAHGYLRLPFAQPLKKVGVALLEEMGATHKEAWELVNTGKDQPLPGFPEVTIRQMLQRLGTEFGRQQIHPELWVRIWRLNAESSINFGVSVVVDDLRFLNEAAAVLELGGTIVMIRRPGFEDGGDHASENGLKGVEPSLVIYNSGSLDDFRARVRKLML